MSSRADDSRPEQDPDPQAPPPAPLKRADPQAAGPYRMTLSLNVLNHLGLNLYSNVPAVLAEVVANAWDADARNVTVEIDIPKGEIVITDDGHGMSREQVNDRYLVVGFARRDVPGGAVTPELGRAVMGRKGIGKLSLFSIAETVEVHTVTSDGERSAFRMVVDDIRRAITERSDQTYAPEALDASIVDIERGTRIVLTDLKKALHQAEAGLRKRLARRFSVIGDEFDFRVSVNGVPITVEERDYFHKLEYMWWFGDDAKKYVTYSKNLVKDEQRSDKTESGYSIGGWIGTVDEAKKLKDPDHDSLNKIVVLVRGKLAQEDILSEFNEGGLYTKYLIGEIHADFLDLDEKEDIATSSRQRIIEDDERYVELRNFVYGELKNIENTWGRFRNQRGAKKALEIPAIEEWFKSLEKDQKKQAERFFGRINQLTVEDQDKRRLFKYAVLAFEDLRYKHNLDKLDQLDPSQLDRFGEVFANLDDIEATLYHQIVSERIEVIEALHEKVDENVKEVLIQQHVYKHLWLLDPAWERATETTYLEESVHKAFADIDAGLTEEERKGRVDIRYAKTSGIHVIVELKRADRVLSSTEIIDQVSKYRNALRKILKDVGRAHEPVEIVVIVGKDLKDWKEENGLEESRKLLEAKAARVVRYQELLDNAYKAYQAYLDKRAEVGRLHRLIRQLDADEFEEDA